MGCGVTVHYLLQTVITSGPAVKTMADSETTAKLRLIVDGLVKNREMLVMIAAFAVTVMVVYLIRRLSIDYAWTIAMVAGAMADIVILLIGDLLYDINISILGALLGSVLALAVAKVLEFFRFCVDYSRTEKVQFEDDEYYYYVKAVPKMMVAAPTKTVKKINAQRSRVSERSVTTERIGGRRSGAPVRSQRAGSGYKSRERSITYGSADGDPDLEIQMEDYEE